MFFVYVLRCSDGSYYTGHTDNLDARLADHHLGTLGGYTSTRRPVQLLWSVSALATKRWPRRYGLRVGHATRRRRSFAETGISFASSLDAAAAGPA
jgi:hypothetical protein